MFPKDRKKWLYQEETRLTKYQHQHRGLNFQKLFLPTVPHRKVKLVGRDNHIYNGSIPKLPEDQLPVEVDEKSIDEEALYKEIRDMKFPAIPEQEPLGPSRRIEGEDTLAKRMAFSPVHVDCTEGLEETLVLGKDGGIYRGKEKRPSKLELDKKLGGTKRPILKVLKTSSTRGYVEPSIVRLQTSDKPTSYGKDKKSLIELPTAEIGHVISIVTEKSHKEDSTIAPDTTNENETIELGREDYQSKEDKALEKSDETDTEKFSEEAEKEEIITEGTGGASKEGGKEDSTEEGTEEATTEGGGEDNTGEDIKETSEEAEESDEEPEESDEEAEESDESPESEKSLDTEMVDESDTKASEKGDIGESSEANELPGAGKTERISEKSDSQ